MIGIVPRKEELAVVEEFFQLFKTPWEIFRAGEKYDVVLVTGQTIPETDAPLLAIFGCDQKDGDRLAMPPSGELLHNCTLRYRGDEFPLYGSLLTFRRGEEQVVCSTSTSDIAGIELNRGSQRVVRIGYNLFQEIAFLLTTGQPVEHACCPSIEMHIALLRDLILRAGIPLLEIPPVPAGYEFTACLTHDIDFVGIRRHKLDHTMWGFLYRSTVGALVDLARRRISLARALKRWKAVLQLPLVYLGWKKDYWVCFDWFLEVERGLSPTYFFVPFKGRPGDRVPAANGARRAVAYDLEDIKDWTDRLQSEGCEIGVHGIDSWHDVKRGREELQRIRSATGAPAEGVRMHWLCRQENTGLALEQAGFSYDSTAGYNQTPGYLCGTTQVFRPLGLKALLELPLHIQDGALFYPGRLGLSDAEAAQICGSFIAGAQRFGGVLTLLWHDRSPGPERYWGEFYKGLVSDLKSRNVWFGSAANVVDWFRKRRAVQFRRVDSPDRSIRLEAPSASGRATPPLRAIILSPPDGENRTCGGAVRTLEEIPWEGKSDLVLNLPEVAMDAPPREALLASGKVS